tara:strand:- start:275 stop:742 length:468 start_codon:yes stop_codon:yes gene_type:complete
MSRENISRVDLGKNEDLAINIFSEFLAIDSLIKSSISRKLPNEMELSHFMVLNYFSHLQTEKTPAQLAKIFRVTKGAMTNTIKKLERKGYVHSRPDWKDGRKKLISLSKSGESAREAAVKNMDPIFIELVQTLGYQRLKDLVPELRDIRIHLNKP